MFLIGKATKISAASKQRSTRNAFLANGSDVDTSMECSPTKINKKDVFDQLDCGKNLDTSTTESSNRSTKKTNERSPVRDKIKFFESFMKNNN